MDIISNRQIEILVKISYIKNREWLSLTDIANEIEINVCNPYFSKISALLIELNILEIVRIVGQAKLIKINHKKLRDFIDEQKVCQFWFDYFNHYHIVSW